MGKKAVPIEGVGAAKCDFVGMDAPRPSRKELPGVDELPKSGNMSADMDAALRKLENRRAAAAIHQHQPQAPHSKPEQNQRQYVRSLRIYSLYLPLLHIRNIVIALLILAGRCSRQQQP